MTSSRTVVPIGDRRAWKLRQCGEDMILSEVLRRMREACMHIHTGLLCGLHEDLYKDSDHECSKKTSEPRRVRGKTLHEGMDSGSKKSWTPTRSLSRTNTVSSRTLHLFLLKKRCRPCHPISFLQATNGTTTLSCGQGCAAEIELPCQSKLASRTFALAH